MTKKIIDEAISLGFTTQGELKAYEMGHVAGERDTLAMVTEDIKKVVDIPEFLQDGFVPESVIYNGEKVK